MKYTLRLSVLIVTIVIMLTFQVNIMTTAQAVNNEQMPSEAQSDKAIEFLIKDQEKNVFWIRNNCNYTCNIVDIIEYLNSNYNFCDVNQYNRLHNILGKITYFLCN